MGKQTLDSHTEIFNNKKEMNFLQGGGTAETVR